MTRLSVLNPATEQPIVELDEAGVEEADEAVARAKAAFPAWRDVAPATGIVSPWCLSTAPA